jgi:hypothetical protein
MVVEFSIGAILDIRVPIGYQKRYHCSLVALA